MDLVLGSSTEPSVTLAWALVLAVASLILGVTYATTRAPATRRVEQEIYIQAKDVGLVVLNIVCELYGFYIAVKWINTRLNTGDDGLAAVGVPEERRDSIQLWGAGFGFLRQPPDVWKKVLFLSMVADIGFSVAKLFPGPRYACDNDKLIPNVGSCLKVMHISIMTASDWFIQFCICMEVHRQHGHETRTKVHPLVKMVEYSSNVALIISQDGGHGWFEVLVIVITCILELSLVFCEFTIFVRSYFGIWYGDSPSINF